MKVNLIYEISNDNVSNMQTFYLISVLQSILKFCDAFIALMPILSIPINPILTYDTKTFI